MRNRRPCALLVVLLLGVGVRGAQADDLLVASANTGSVLSYDGSSGAFKAVLFTQVFPQALEWGLDGKLYVANLDKVLRYNGSTGVPDGSFQATGGLSFAQGMRFGVDGNLYVASFGTNEVLRFNGSTGASMGAFVSAASGGLNQPYGVEFGPDDNLYVASNGTKQILKYDGRTGAFLGVFVTTTNPPRFMVFGPDGNLYVGENEVRRYNGTTGAFIDVFGAASGASWLEFGPDGNLYATEFTKVERFDGQTGTSLGDFVAAGSGGLNGAEGLTFLCADDERTLCLNKRFRVKASWTTLAGLSGLAHAVKLTPDTGYLWFFSSANVEMVVKVLDGCPLNGHYWLFAGGLTNVQVKLTVTDTQTGIVKTYNNPQSTAFQPIQDTGAFATCP